MPNHCDGRESQKSQEVKSFADWLNQLTGLPIRFFDERYTTRLAERLLQEGEFTKKQRKSRIDRVAAHLILEHFLEYDKATTRRES
jgi:putative Holliday junction resolvase